MIDELKQYGLVYLASPYTRFPRGPEVAFREICAIAADLIRLCVKVYSPIVHTHPIAVHGHLPTMDHEFWIAFDRAMIAKSDALLIAQMESWDQSFGIAEERKAFTGRPIYFLDPVAMVVRPTEAQ